MNTTAIKLVVKLWHDDMPESPCDTDGWKVYSFSNRHANYKHPEKFEDDEDLQRKLKIGLAFKLAYFEHGQCEWSLSGEGYQCQWDSVSFAGLLIWEQDEGDLGPESYEDRQKDARAFIARYTQWCNGEVYGYTFEALKVCECCGQDAELSEDEADVELASCGGYYHDDIDGMVIDMKDNIGSNWADYEVKFEEHHAYGVAEECKRLWKKCQCSPCDACEASGPAVPGCCCNC
jgi:hypothetical protein